MIVPSDHVISVPSDHVMAVAEIIPVRLYCAETELSPIPTSGYPASVFAGIINIHKNKTTFHIPLSPLFLLPELGPSLQESVALSIR